MGKREKRARKYDTEPLVDLIRFFVRKNGGFPTLEKYTGLKQSTYYGRNRTPDKYNIGELRALMLACDIPKEYILNALDKALTG